MVAALSTLETRNKFQFTKGFRFSGKACLHTFFYSRKALRDLSRSSCHSGKITCSLDLYWDRFPDFSCCFVT